jgi:hypothetical protein
MEWQMARKSYVFCGKTFDAKRRSKTCSADCARAWLLKYQREYQRAWLKDPANREREREYMREWRRKRKKV